MSKIITEIVEGPVSIALLDAAGCGGECVFIGRTRPQTHPQYGDLRHLEYEVYEPMVARLLNQLARDAAGQFDCRTVRIVHARGPVPVGEASVVIQTLTPHRAEAFTATRHLIERLKKELPIWKHEVWQHGKTFHEGWQAGNMKDV